jgi:hypothetical protein
VEYDILKYINFILIPSYLIFIFLAIQIWLLWKDIDKNEVEIKTFVSESFFKKNFAYVFSFSIFFMINEISGGTALPDALVYAELSGILALISLVLFTYEWYSVLKTIAPKKSLPKELTGFTRH